MTEDSKEPSTGGAEVVYDLDPNDVAPRTGEGGCPPGYAGGPDGRCYRIRSSGFAGEAKQGADQQAP